MHSHLHGPLALPAHLTAGNGRTLALTLSSDCPLAKHLAAKLLFIGRGSRSLAHWLHFFVNWSRSLMMRLRIADRAEQQLGKLGSSYSPVWPNLV